MLTSLPLSAVLDAFTSPDPTPGGGSASALAGAIGASLLAMVAGMPKTKTGTPEARAALDASRARLLELQAALVELVDRDAAAYNLVVAAYRKPKATDEDKAARKAAIQDAMRVATEVPVETMAACADAMREGRVVAEFGNASAKSDVGTGMQLLMAAISGAGFNVEINITSVSDPEVVAGITARVASIGRDATDSLGLAFESAGIIDLMRQASAAGRLFVP